MSRLLILFISLVWASLVFVSWGGNHDAATAQDSPPAQTQQR